MNKETETAFKFYVRIAKNVQAVEPNEWNKFNDNKLHS